MKYMIERKRYTFIDRLLDDARFSNLLLVNVWNDVIWHFATASVL